MIGGIVTFVAIGIGSVLVIWLIIYIIRKLYKVILVLIAAVLIFLAIGFLFSVSPANVKDDKEDSGTTDSSGIITDNNNDELDENENQDKPSIQKSIKWTSYYNKPQAFNYKITENDYNNAQFNRSNYSGSTWGEIYQNLYQNDRQMLAGIYLKYDSLKNNSDALDFARLIVSSIQEVPYTWILSESCQDAPNVNEIKNSGYECLGNIKNYAVLSPAEFMVTHKGDCDTKALVLYTILKRFNYDVCILISEQYAHAMLGINISATGKYLNSSGKRYYVWETTVKGMDVGLMPPDYSNMAFWDVALY